MHSQIPTVALRYHPPVAAVPCGDQPTLPSYRTTAQSKVACTFGIPSSFFVCTCIVMIGTKLTGLARPIKQPCGCTARLRKVPATCLHRSNDLRSSSQYKIRSKRCCRLPCLARNLHKPCALLAFVVSTQISIIASCPNTFALSFVTPESGPNKRGGRVPRQEGATRGFWAKQNRNIPYRAC